MVMPSGEELLREELDGAYRQLREAGRKARQLRTRLDATTTALHTCLNAGLPEDVKIEALKALEVEDG